MIETQSLRRCGGKIRKRNIRRDQIPLLGNLLSGPDVVSAIGAPTYMTLTERDIMAEEKTGSSIASSIVAIVGIVAIIILVYFVFLKGGGDGDKDINVNVKGVEDVLPDGK